MLVKRKSEPARLKVECEPEEDGLKSSNLITFVTKIKYSLDLTLTISRHFYSRQ